MGRIIRFSVSYPLAVLALTFLCTAGMCVFIPQVHLKLDARSLVPATDPSFTKSDKATELFNIRDVVMLGIVNEDSGIYEPKTLALIQRLTSKLSSVDGVVTSSVTSIATIPSMSIADRQIELKPLITSRASENPQDASRVRDRVESLDLNDGILVAQDGHAATIFSEIHPDANRFAVLEQVRKLAAEENKSGANVYLGGTALAQAVLGIASARDLARLVPLVLIGLFIALTLAFRNPVPAILSLLEIGISLLLTIGVMGLTGQSVFITTLILPVILVSVGVSDDVYALKHYFTELKNTAGISRQALLIKVFGSLTRPICLTTLSTIIGLLSLTVTRLEPLIIFGIFGSLAIVLSTLLTFTLIPALLVLLGPRAFRTPRSALNDKPADTTAMLRPVLVVGPRRIIVATVAIAFLAVLLTTELTIDDSWIRNLPPNSDVAVGDKVLNRTLAGSTTIDFMIDSGQNRGFLEPQFMLALANIEHSTRTLPHVGAVHSLFNDVLRLSASLRGMAYDSYRAALAKNELTLDRAEIEQSLQLMIGTRRTSLDNWVDKDYRHVRMTVFVRSADYQRIADVLRTTLNAARNTLGAEEKITPFGDGWISYNTVRLLVEGQTWSIGLALLTDLVVLSILWKSVRSALTAVIPVAFSVLIVFACLAATGVSLGIANSMFTGISIGIGMDFAIHLTDSYHRGRLLGMTRDVAMSRALTRVGPAVATSAVTIMIGFLVLTLSQITPNVQLGVMICLSLTVCAISTLLLLPGMVLGLSSSKTKLNIRPAIMFVCIVGSVGLGACSKSPLPDTSSTPNQPSANEQSEKPQVEKADVQALTNETVPAADDLIKTYNTRNLGSPGWRRVLMELNTDNRVTSTFTVVNIWSHYENEERMLFLLEEPGGLKGTSYLLRENTKSSPEMQVHLFLPAGERKVLEVAHDNLDEGLLGSDFTYSDMRMLLPNKGWRYRVTGKTRLLNEPAWVVDAQPFDDSAERTSSWSRIRFYLAHDFQLLLGADFFANNDEKPDEEHLSKQMRVQSFKHDNGVWIPTKMLMAGSQQRFTLLTLQTAHFSTATMAPQLFSSDHLPFLADKIRLGWNPEHSPLANP